MIFAITRETKVTAIYSRVDKRFADVGFGAFSRRKRTQPYFRGVPTVDMLTIECASRPSHPVCHLQLAARMRGRPHGGRSSPARSPRPAHRKVGETGGRDFHVSAAHQRDQQHQGSTPMMMLTPLPIASGKRSSAAAPRVRSNNDGLAFLMSPRAVAPKSNCGRAAMS